MLIDSLTSVLRASGALGEISEKLFAGKDVSLGLASSARPFVTSVLYTMAPRCMLVVVPGEEAAERFARSVASYLGEEKVAHFPARSDYPFSPKIPQAQEIARRTRAAWFLSQGENVVVVASAASMLRCLPPHDAGVFAPVRVQAETECADLHSGEVLDRQSLLQALIARGYENSADLDGPGTFCVRGGTVDVFPGNSVYPIRVDFFGDEVDEIRRIVPSTGQTIASLPRFDIYPVKEYRITPRGAKRARNFVMSRAESDPDWRDLLGKLQSGEDFLGADALLPHLYRHTETLGDYATGQALVVLDEPRSLMDDASRAYEDIFARSQGSPLEGLYAKPASLNFGGSQRFIMSSIMHAGDSLDAELSVKRTEIAGGAEKMVERLRSFVERRYTVVFSASNPKARKDMSLLFVDNQLPIVEVLDCASGKQALLRPGLINVVDVDIPLGMVIPKGKLALVSIHDTQGRNSSIRNRRRIDLTEITFPFKPGDYVVHAVHGVAFFKDLVRQEVAGTMRDYLLLEYAEGDKLYVPVEQLDRVTRYVGPEGASPRLTRLNTSDWSRSLSKAHKATRQLAFDLVDVYTRRTAVQGFRYSADTPWQREMEESFPYEETPDQLSAIAEVKADMQSAKPMDRLICGDVGFGKTEVAMRAAFKAVQDNKQVMVLCPTTILAQQHYATFKDRFDPFGIDVEVLSRFRTPAEQRATLKGLASGAVDVLVGTHRLLSRDVNPHDLGLVIIDEEQRFGVQHKEQLKNLREHIDVLTLSATPIPRTLQMSLSGVRDTSHIMTPPSNRRPVEVHVGEWDVDVVSAAIRREIQRGGQVYYVSNRVRTIEEAVARVGEAANEARVGIAHGKMDKDSLERVMEEFSAGKIDVLVATTIIESGIDNPHTNTLIIEDSQRLGLAQMYQLKGRVGRSSRQAYAYFMFPEHVTLTEEATARLEAINDFHDLGSGMRIAMRDLEIRGAGNLLGAEQSGNMSAVGFDLFAQMLSSAISAAREGGTVQADAVPPALSDIVVNMPVHAYIPEEYVPDADARVLLYRKLAYAETTDVVDELRQATIGSYGQMPQACSNMFSKARIRALAVAQGINLVIVAAGKLNVEPIEIPKEMIGSVRRYGGKYLQQSHKLSLPLKYLRLEEDSDLVDAVGNFLLSLFEEKE